MGPFGHAVGTRLAMPSYDLDPYDARRVLPSFDACTTILIMPSFDQLTIRSISSALRAALDREAARRGQSLNKTVLALLAERLGLADATAPVQYDDLDELAGTWSKSEATRFDDALRAQRQVDARLWR
jgi:hypothetical protein